MRLLYSEYDPRISAVYAREKQVQGWGRAKRLALIRGDHAALRPLAKKHFPSSIE
jgi:putative endonuclease